MEPKPYGIIYLLIDSTNDWEYVGQTTQTFERRFSQHKYGDQCIDHVIQKRGENLIETAILKVCYSKEELDYWEKRFIESRDTMKPNGYNLTEGGDGSKGFLHTAESKSKMSASRTGKKHSDKTRAKMSVTHKGKKYFLGHRHSDETRARMSIAHKGKKYSLGYHHSDETKARMSAARNGEKHPFYGKHHTTKSCAQISATKRSESLYRNLLNEIDNRQLSYNGLAKLMCLSVASVSRKMGGKRKFTTNEIDKLVEIFNKPAEYLMQRDD